MRSRAGVVIAVATGAVSILAFALPVAAAPPDGSAPAVEVPATSDDSPKVTTPSPTTTMPGAYDERIPIDGLEPGSRPGSTFQTKEPPPPPTTLPPPPPPPPPGGLPANSGVGRRVVYSKSQQRVWAVDGNGTVIKMHRVSGKLEWCDPRPGSYSVFSRSRHTYAIQNPSIVWGYMVRFTKGCNGGNIGFHEIPFQYGRPVQSIAQLGQPLSSGCVRQARDDAVWMWNWAGIGTRVVVLG